MKQELISDYADTEPRLEKRDTGYREKTMRIARGIELEEVAKYLGITVEQLKEIENDGEFSDEHLHKLSVFYNTSFLFTTNGLNQNLDEVSLL